MKTVYWIIGIVLTLGIAGAIIWYFYSKKKTQNARLSAATSGGNIQNRSDLVASTTGTDISNQIQLPVIEEGIARKVGDTRYGYYNSKGEWFWYR